MVRRICFLIILLATLSTMPCVPAYSTEEQVEVLRGLEGIYVVVGRLRPEIERDGLYERMLQDDAEFMLRTAGVKVLSREEWLQAPGSPYLHLNVGAFKYSDGYVYRIRLRLVEKVRLTRKSTVTEATTLSMRDDPGLTPSLSAIREEARDLLEKFTNVWRAANPKRPPRPAR